MSSAKCGRHLTKLIKLPPAERPAALINQVNLDKLIKMGHKLIKNMGVTSTYKAYSFQPCYCLQVTDSHPSLLPPGG